MKKTKQALMLSLVSLILCVSMLIGTTFAWFTDSVASGNNIIKSGNLDVEMYWTDDLTSNNWRNAEDEADGVPFDYDNWEPGYTEVRYVKVVNAGNLALKYALSLGSLGQVGKLCEVIGVYYSAGVTENIADRSLGGMKSLGYLKDAINGGNAAEGALLPAQEIIVAVALHMDEKAGNEYQKQSVGDGFVFKLVATQAVSESDSFDNTYDKDALFPEIEGGSAGVSVKDKVDADNKLTEDVSITSADGKISAIVPKGTLLKAGVQSLQLSVTPKSGTDSNVTLEENEERSSWDVHIEGLAEGNTVPALVTVEKAMATGLNIGNYAIYHVENGQTVKMTAGDLTVHNGFTYDPATGDVVLALASFSEVAVVAEPAKWEGNFDYSWYINAVAPVDGEAVTEYTIANADQLAAFGAIVGGMDGQTADDFAGKTVKLVCNIVIGDITDEDGRNVMFYPIGYYNTTKSYTKQAGVSVTSGFRNFAGTFDGNGHTVSDFYQNTWEAFGDYNDGYSGTPNHYRDGFGLFGKVYCGTVKNLTVKNFSSDGEFTTTGTIAAYAEGATFENIAIFNCNPRVYNIGNGGIVGCVGWYAKEANLKTTFKNITVDNTNKITALWGSWDVACGGIVGQYYPTSGQTSAGTPKNGGIHFENCHVAAQIDVYNDVCANYQYYAYRYSGILLGSVRENEVKDGHEYPKMDGITASGCTVHFGDWNDYYYCELVANSLASYTHDHQMSRLEQVQSVDVANKKVVTLAGEEKAIPASGAANYVVVKAKDTKDMWKHGDGHDYADCYHFVNGQVWNHEEAGTEMVDGVEVLKEDKQCVYREFNNLVTGYGWGVTSKGVKDMDGVEILDRKDKGNSITKFEGKDIAELESGVGVEIGNIFDLIVDENELKTEGLIVTITDLDDTDGTATSTFVSGGADWKKGVLTINGKGRIAITIQDYYFCEPTTIEVTVIDPMTSLTVDAVKLYTVGQNVTINSVVVSYERGQTKVLGADEYTVSVVDMTFGGKKTVAITYNEYGKSITYEFEINVTDGFNSLVATPKKLTYNINEAVKKNDFVVSAVAADGSKGGIADYSVSSVDTSTKGIKTVTISFTNPSTGKVISTQCTIKVLNLSKVTGNNIPKVTYWHAGNFAASSDWNHIEVPGTGYESFVGKTYTGANGEVATGFNLVGHTAAQPMSGYNNLTVANAKPYSLVGINGTVAFENKTILSMGYYVDGRLSSLQDSGTLIPQGNGNTAYIVQANLYDFAPGTTHTVTFVVEIDEGFIDLCTWTITMAEASDDAFVDTDKPNVNVVIIAGQSNACGASPIIQSLKDQYSNVNYHNVYMQYKNVYVEDNGIYTASENYGFEKYVYGMGGFQSQHFGPEAGIAQILANDPAAKNEQWFIIKYAATGTTITQWIGGVNLADEMTDYVKNSIANLSDEYDVQIRSLVWMQGETDAVREDWAGAYKENEQKFITKVRSELAAYATRTNASVPGSGISFISAAVAPNSLNGQQTSGMVGNTFAEGGLNDWVYSATVNWSKFENGEHWYLPVVTGGGSVFGGNIAAGWYYTNQGAPGIINSAYIDTYALLSKNYASDDEKAQYVLESDKTDWAHYSSASMMDLGEWFGEAIVYVMGKETVSSSGSASTETTYTVTYNSNGGNAVSPGKVIVAEGGSIVLLPATRTGYTFNGWSDGSKTYAAGATYTPSGDVTLTAQWEKIKYNITVQNNASNYCTITGIKTGDQASEGDVITFTLKATSRRYFTVTDSNGNTLYKKTRLNANGTATITLTMPAGDVTVTITQSSY